MTRLVLLGVTATLAAGCSEGLRVFVLHAPASVSAGTDGRGGLDLDWHPVPGAEGYRIYIAPFDGVTSENVDSLGGDIVSVVNPPYHIAGALAEGVLHSAVVSAVVGGRESEDSPRVRAIPRFVPLLPDEPDFRLEHAGDQMEELGTAIAAGDVNGDGRDDLLAGAPDPMGTGGAVRLFHARAEGGFPGALWSDTGVVEHGSALDVGDLDADGYADLVVGSPADGNGSVAAWTGGPALPGVSAFWVTNGTQSERLGTRVAVVGDVDGDGDVEVAASAPTDPDDAEVRLFPGGANGPSTTPFATLPAGGGDLAAPTGVVPVRDITGDGLPEVLVSIPGYDVGGADRGRAEIFSVAGGSPVRVWEDTGEENEVVFGWSAASADVNEDGFADLVVGARGGPNVAGRLYLYRHDPLEGLRTDAQAVFSVQGSAAGALFGHAIAAAGDVDGDGREDLFVGAPRHPVGGEATGRVYLLRGDGDDFNEVWSADGDEAGEDFGWSLASGDFDGNGRKDLAVGAPRRTTENGDNPQGGGISVFLTRVRRPPAAHAGEALRGSTGERLAPRGATFTDAALRRRWRCLWDRDDGTDPVVLEPCTPETAGDVSFTWTARGTYTLRLRVERVEDGAFSESATMVKVE